MTLLEILKEMETGNRFGCVVCGQLRSDGHTKDCLLAQAIAEAEKGPPTGFTSTIRNRLAYVGPYFLGTADSSEKAIKRDLGQSCDLIDALTAKLKASEELLEKARTYTGLEGYGCPLCEYKEGKFIKSCEMHRQLDDSNERLQKYGRCRPNCESWHSGPGTPCDCTCGFEE